MTRPAGSSFDRLRPRAPLASQAPPQAGQLPASPKDEQGRRALFSVDEPGVAAFGSVSIDCSSCHQVSVLALRQALRLAFPSLYLPLIRGRYPARLRCPACNDWTWTRVRIRL